MSIVRNDSDKNTKWITSESNNFILLFQKKKSKKKKLIRSKVNFSNTLFGLGKSDLFLLWSLFKKLSRSKV